MRSFAHMPLGISDRNRTTSPQKMLLLSLESTQLILQLLYNYTKFCNYNYIQLTSTKNH